MWWSCLGPHHTEVFVSHRSTRLTVHGRRILVERVLAGRPVAHAAAEMGISRPTAHKWVRRWRAEGEAGLHDRSSRPLAARQATATGRPPPTSARAANQ
ncbi:helix-turn-helix domain-containing protein [Streptomyces sp. NPDC091265]|uniref:helix-turn-helix domain-containing protein n=1 Tax=Streptomyces sp. NPDC091265 TaxID=3365977 RepID=UPI00381F8F0E